MSVASQSGSKVLVEILDVMLSLSLSLRAITPGCGGGGIWMLCSLVAWEEEDDDAWAVSCDECGALDFDEAGGVRVVVPSPKQIVSGCQRYPRNFRLSSLRAVLVERCGELPRGHGKPEMEVKVE